MKFFRIVCFKDAFVVEIDSFVVTLISGTLIYHSGA
jgi:hypothetical protein